jgi:hypothetical protein
MRAVSLVVAAATALLLVSSCTHTVNKIVEDPGPGEGLPGGPRASEPCKPGSETFAIDAFDVTPSEAGAACDIANVLDEDGSMTGIAGGSGAVATIAGQKVNGCVGVEFGESIVLASLVMRMRPVSGACGHACTEGGSEGCGTGWKIGIFVGPSFDKLQYLQQLSLTTKDVFEYRVAVHRTYNARFAVVCREATPETGDDVAIDSISGLCGDPPSE